MKFRLRIFLILLLLVLFVLLYRLYDLIFDSPIPYWQSNKYDNKVRRGTIYDSEGNILALSIDSISIGIRPSDLKSIKETVEFLQPITGISEEEIIHLIDKNANKSFFWLKRRIPISRIPNYQKIKIRGVELQIEPSRFYPNKNLASTLIGFSGVDNEGLSGLEFHYNDTLTSRNTDNNTGNNLYLSINYFMQYTLDKYLSQAFIASESKSAVGIISETKTGKILAMTSLPNYNTTNYYNQATEYKNRAINDVYEPGSTFKMFILATLIKEKLINEKETYFCPGYFQKNSFKIRCSSAHGKITMKQAIQKSCNTAIIMAALRLPTNVLSEALLAFGFGKSTDIDLPGESSGILSQTEKWDNSLKMSLSIGHGIAVTPIQMIMAANSVVNGGRLLKPYIVEKIINPDGKIINTTKVIEKRKILDNEISTFVLSYLKTVVEAGGTGYQANLDIPEVEVAGKTGTSIKSNKEGYMGGKYQASFIGFLPAKNPHLSIFLLLDEPSKGEHQGGALSAPIFKKIVQDILPFTYQTSTEEIKKLKNMNYTLSFPKINTNKMPNLMGRSKKDIFQIIFNNFGGEHTIRGTGYVVKQVPLPETPIKKPYRFFIDLDFKR